MSIMTHKELFKTGKVAIKVGSQKERTAVENLYDDINPGNPYHRDYPYIYCNFGNYSGNYDTECFDIVFDSIVDFLSCDPLKALQREFVLNKEYTAKIKGNRVIVGCQVFTKAKILELAELLK